MKYTYAFYLAILTEFEIYFPCRRVNEFKAIYEYSLFTFFIWTLLSVCSILLTVQLQLVNRRPIIRSKIDQIQWKLRKQSQTMVLFWSKSIFIWAIASIFSWLDCLVQLFVNAYSNDDDILISISFQKVEKNSNRIEIIITSLLAIWTFGFIFFICEPGERVKYHFEKFYDELCRSDWNLFPLDVQQIYLTFLLQTQRPIIIKSYGNISCTRETFAQVKIVGSKFN